MQPFIDLGVFSVRTFTALVGGAVLLTLGTAHVAYVSLERIIEESKESY